MENRLLKQLSEPRRPQGFAEVFFFGKIGSFTCMVMELLGKSLEECMEACKGKMDPCSAVLIAEQALRRIEYLHSKGVVHRDIKPENFMYGRDGKIHQLHLIDFGLSDTYWSRRHVSQSGGNSMVGTARYCSINTHKGINQTRRDDLEAIAHMLIYFLRGALPWSGLKGAKTEKEKYEMIGKRKEATPLDELCAEMPSAFKLFLSYARKLPFAERPDYERLSHIFRKAREELGITSDHQLQWLDESTLSSNLCPLEPYVPHGQPDDKIIVDDPDSGRCFPFLWRRQEEIPVKDSE
ncbi:Casein kinase I isoform gamma-1 (CKI-gamma 1) [Durusdinium trenchii]